MTVRVGQISAHVARFGRLVVAQSCQVSSTLEVKVVTKILAVLS